MPYASAADAVDSWPERIAQFLNTKKYQQNQASVPSSRWWHETCNYRTIHATIPEKLNETDHSNNQALQIG